MPAVPHPSPRRRRPRAGLIVLLAAPMAAVACLAPTARAVAMTEVTFASSGTWTVPAEVATVDVLVVGGGGGGSHRGGGGGGEVKVCRGVAVSQGNVLTATVGSGGLYDNVYVAGTGGTSSVAVGGAPACAASGGLGGKGAQNDAAPNQRYGGASGNGMAGGASSTALAGGGGGGAGAAGGAVVFVASARYGGAGGVGVAPGSLATPGLFSDVTATFYGGGGGGGVDVDYPGGGNAGTGGTGGGGAGSPRTPFASPTGAANTGGGGGGSGVASGLVDVAGGPGGSGYVAIRYVIATPEPTPDAVPTPTATPTESGASTPADAASPTRVAPTRLAGRFRTARATGRVTTTGALPEGATSVTQIASIGRSTTTRRARQMSRPTRAKASCTIARGTYRCSVVLTRGAWTLRTVASGPSGVVATSTRRVVVRATSRPVTVTG